MNGIRKQAHTSADREHDDLKQSSDTESQQGHFQRPESTGTTFECPINCIDMAMTVQEGNGMLQLAPPASMIMVVTLMTVIVIMMAVIMIMLMVIGRMTRMRMRMVRRQCS